MPERSHQAAAAGLGGLAATVVDVAVLAVLVESGCAIAPAALLGACCGAGVSFCFNRRVAFRDQSQLSWQQLARFAAVAWVAALTMSAAMQLATAVLGIPYLIAKTVCAVLVFAGWSLPAQRRFVFGYRLDARASSMSLL
jgi:putative flippase GtrA